MSVCGQFGIKSMIEMNHVLNKLRSVPRYRRNFLLPLRRDGSLLWNLTSMIPHRVTNRSHSTFIAFHIVLYNTSHSIDVGNLPVSCLISSFFLLHELDVCLTGSIRSFSIRFIILVCHTLTDPWNHVSLQDEKHQCLTTQVWLFEVRTILLSFLLTL